MRTEQKGWEENSSRRSLSSANIARCPRGSDALGHVCLPCSMLQSCGVLRVSDYAKEPVFGIGLLSPYVVPLPALGVPRCPLNSYKSCAFKETAE